MPVFVRVFNARKSTGAARARFGRNVIGECVGGVEANVDPEVIELLSDTLEDVEGTLDGLRVLWEEHPPAENSYESVALLTVSNLRNRVISARRSLRDMSAA